MLPLPSFDNLLDVFRNCTKKERTLALYLAYVCTAGLDAYSSVGNSLVSVYVEAGNIHSARKVFDRLESKNGHSWNSLLIAYVRVDEPQNALELYETMGEDSFLLNDFGFVALLKACSNLAQVDYGLKLHSQIARKNLLQHNVIIGTALVDMYAKCGVPTMAQEVFDKLPDKDVVSWTALIAGYAQHNYGKEALRCFDLMQSQGVKPNATTFSSVLKACGSIRALDKGSKIHDEILRKGLIKTNQFVGTALVDMYAKCGSVAKAQEVFDILPMQDTVSWTALITGYAQCEHGEDALKCLEKMRHLNVPTDTHALVSCLKACCSIVASDSGKYIIASESGKDIHAEIIRKGLLETNSVLGTALIDMYAKCGMLGDAQSVFKKLPESDVHSWNALISGHAQHKSWEEVMMCFDEMQKKGFLPDSTTCVCFLNACGHMGATERGEELHAEIEQKGLFGTNLIVGNALVEMYVKCGLLSEAHEVFDKLQLLDIISWNTLISGYAHVGDIKSVLYMLHCMKCEGIEPDSITFISIFNAIIHAGLVVEGEVLFESLSRDFGISPSLEHYTRMVALFGCAGQLDKAATIFKSVSSASDIIMSLTLLGACRKWGNIELGRQAFKRAVKLDAKEGAAYICMFNIYKDAGMLEDARKVETMRVRKQAWKHREGFEGLIS
ncbi:hypothetical protein GOP47_0028701 [Adiantum capillus-veneris]|nr:hypothetical protein GOP47_0028701 [Adiantum capillus-veneris]